MALGARPTSAKQSRSERRRLFNVEVPETEASCIFGLVIAEKACYLLYEWSSGIGPGCPFDDNQCPTPLPVRHVLPSYVPEV